MKNNSQDGFLMFEMLLSIFVVSLGVIGAAAMQLNALRTTQQSAYQTTALQLAAEMATQMRVLQRANNQIGLLTLYTELDYSADQEPVVPAVTCYALESNCTAADLVQFNLSEWEHRIKASLPNGRAVICRDQNPWDASTKKYKWECSGAANTGDPIVIKMGWTEKKYKDQGQDPEDDHDTPLVALFVGS